MKVAEGGSPSGPPFVVPRAIPVPNLRTALHRWHVEHQARLVPFAGWDMPVQYTGIVAEHRAVRTAAGLFDISHMARFGLAGRDAQSLLETVFTNSVAAMKPGQVRYGLLCREDGGILDDILVYRGDHEFTAVVNAGNREKIWNWLDEHASGRSVELRDRTFETTMLALQGPRAVELAVGLFADDVSGLKYYSFTASRYRDQPCVVSRTGYTGEDGYEVIVPSEVGVLLWDELVGRGAVPCGLGARDTLRLEAGMPLYGHELTEAVNPIQARLAWAVKFEKGEFVGRAALLAADATAPVRVGLEIEGKRAAREGSAVVDRLGQPVGTVTSGSYCPWLDRSLAMAYVRPDRATPGEPLGVDVRGAILAAAVVPLPFYKRKK